jgi:hypothetical protein
MQIKFMRAGRLPGTDIYRDIHRYGRIATTATEIADVRIFRFDSPLMFINVELFRRRLYNDCRSTRAPARTSVVDRRHLYRRGAQTGQSELSTTHEFDTRAAFEAFAYQLSGDETKNAEPPALLYHPRLFRFQLHRHLRDHNT